ncbi:YdcF family protein [Pseudorhodoplanes sp.]|uniref:YdcF family protein n=1 Tax=Pseudorhodoplanes sp. TaxID=1934341 RepID=UPI002BFF37BC|nr:YdcF family protein [Pseudorhodoplanes sp.]HWV42480.1 YdcF family protein [Pseudorhodoplanes sp.]
MMFGLSKVLGFFALPSNLLIVLALAGIVLVCTRYRRFGQGLLIGAVLLLAVVGFSPLGNVLMLSLEERFPKWDARGRAPDGIIVLGGAVSPDVSAARKEIALNEAAERMTVVAKLARDYPSARIVFTGGSGRLWQGATEAEAVPALFESFGIPASRIVLEDRARTTAENASYTKALVQPKPNERWLLVTSAHHMPRSIGVFRAAGFPVEAYPVDFRTRGAADLVGPFGSLAGGLARTDAALHEWAGLLVYWLTGRTAELIPGPRRLGGCDLARENCRP